MGRAIVEDALRTGAEVTLFGRGKTGTDLFADLTRLIGDRDTGDYAALGAGSWDAVSNVCQAMLDGSMEPAAGAAQIEAAVQATRSHSAK